LFIPQQAFKAAEKRPDKRLTITEASCRYDISVIRLVFVLFGAFAVGLLILGWLGDRALRQQVRAAEDAALSEIDEKARMAAQSVRGSLAQGEQALLTNRPWPGVTVAWLVDSSEPSFPSDSFVPYLQRSQSELYDLLTSVDLTPNGLPEAVVAALALESPKASALAVELLLNGRVPFCLEDLRYISIALLHEKDERLLRFRRRLEKTPLIEELPVTPDFRRRLTEEETVEGWSRNTGELWSYEIPADVLLSKAGVDGYTSLGRGRSLPSREPGSRTVSVSEVEGFTLVVAPEVQGRLRIRTLRVLLWAALLTSVLGGAAILRALRVQTRALAREKAFLANVTHELRTPLASIRLFGETLSEGRGDAVEYGAMVAQESERLGDLVERVLAATRISERPSFTQLDPADLVQSAVDLNLDRAEHKSIQISLGNSLRKGSLPKVLWDHAAVQQALINLLDNAIKYGNPGGRIRVTAAVDRGTVNLAVSDDGPGIRRQDRKRLFGRFQRGEVEESGTGLGLYVVDQVARAHGGRVDLITEEGRGSTFTLILPIEPAQTKEARV